MAVNYLYLSAFSTAASLAGFQWWILSQNGGTGEMDLLLGSHVTVALLVNFVANVFVLVLLSLKTLFFAQLYASETRKVLESFVNYAIYKGTFLPLVVPPNISQVVLWSTWLIFLYSLKMFQSLAKDRLERLNASPTATPSNYFRVYSALLLVLAADLLWMKLCLTIYRSFISSLFLLLFFEPLSIAFETLQAIMVHGFQFLEISQRHSDDSDFLDIKNHKTASGSLSEWKGILIRHVGFILDMMSLLMALGHYLVTWWLHGMAFHLVDVVLFLYIRSLASAIIKRIRTYVKLRKALSSLDAAIPDASYDELCAYEDECAICRESMARAKKLSCGHLFHLACLRSWLDHGLTEVYSCPTCRRPLFVSHSQGQTSSNSSNLTNDQQLAQNLNLGLGQHQPHALPLGAFQQQDSSNRIWRGTGFGSNWVLPWANPPLNVTNSSATIRSAQLSGVQMMMRQLASVNENNSHGFLEEAAMNPWSSQNASGSSSIPSTSLNGLNRNTGNLRFRSNTPTSANMSNMWAMVERVREVLPYIPDELIVQDLLRTNNTNVTVNNLLMQ